MPQPVHLAADWLRPIVAIAGEEDRYRPLDRLLHYGCSGFGVAVIDQGAIAWNESYGRVDRQHGSRPVDAETLFSGASISKPITATIALQLVAEGKLDLDQNVNDRLRQWRVPENDFTAKAPVTLRRLLSHTAGTNVHGFGGHPDDGPLPDLPHMLEGLPPARNPPVRVVRTPGEATQYSGGGTTIVELLIVEATGRDFAQVAQERVLGPAGMTRSTFVQPLPAQLRGNAAEAVENSGEVTRRDFRVPQVAAGGLWTTPTDYARFLLATRDAVLGHPNPLLNRDVAQTMMQRCGDGEFGLGWALSNDGPSRYFHHSGSNGGFQCNAVCYPGQGQGAVVMTNAESGALLYAEVFNGLATHYRWPGFLADPKTIVAMPQDRLKFYAGEFRIVAGTESLAMHVSVAGGQLVSSVPGMRNGVRTMLMTDRGTLVSRSGPFETQPVFGDDGYVTEYVARSAQGAELLRATRA